MTITEDAVATQVLSLPAELILMLLNEESGYFHQVPGWGLNCAVVGAVLGELSLRSRIDTDMDSLFVLDDTETGNPVLDPILKEIASEPAQHNAQYWIERLAHHAESIIDSTLDRLVQLKVLEYHDGEFWTVAPNVEQTVLFDDSQEGTGIQFVKTRIRNEIFNNEIPDPRDVIIICLVNTCDVFRFMFNMDEEAEEAYRVHLQHGPDRPVHSGCGLTQPCRPAASPLTSGEEDSDRLHDQVAVQPEHSHWQHSRAIC